MFDVHKLYKTSLKEITPNLTSSDPETRAFAEAQFAALNAAFSKQPRVRSERAALPAGLEPLRAPVGPLAARFSCEPEVFTRTSTF